jgi:hypothetical protein
MKWIDINERMPEERTRVIVSVTDIVYSDVYYGRGLWTSTDGDKQLWRHTDTCYPLNQKLVTHWMPLPDVYKQDLKFEE